MNAWVYNGSMKTALRVRLDADTSKKLAELERMTGWSTSRLVRQGLQLLSATERRRKKSGVIGLGAFSSKTGDLGSNQKRLKGFGK
jgi:predicted transcriptional regulator